MKTLKASSAGIAFSILQSCYGISNSNDNLVSSRSIAAGMDYGNDGGKTTSYSQMETISRFSMRKSM